MAEGDGRARCVCGRLKMRFGWDEAPKGLRDASVSGGRWF